MSYHPNPLACDIYRRVRPVNALTVVLQTICVLFSVRRSKEIPPCVTTDDLASRRSSPGRKPCVADRPDRHYSPAAAAEPSRSLPARPRSFSSNDIRSCDRNRSCGAVPRLPSSIPRSQYRCPGVPPRRRSAPRCAAGRRSGGVGARLPRR